MLNKIKCIVSVMLLVTLDYARGEQIATECQQIAVEEIFKYLLNDTVNMAKTNFLFYVAAGDTDDFFHVENTTIGSMHKSWAMNQTQYVTLCARWAFNFERRETRKRAFYHTPPTLKHTLLDMMRKDDIFPYANLKDLNASAVELALQHELAPKLLVLLPKDISDFLPLLDKIKHNVTEVLHMVRKHLKPTLVRLSMPKFKIKHKSEIPKEKYTTLYGSATINIDNFTQQADMEVNEDSIGRLERITVLFSNAYSSVRQTPEDFMLNKPFIFILYTVKGVQLLGQFVHP